MGEPYKPTTAFPQQHGKNLPHFRAYAIRPYGFPDGKQIHYNPIKRGFLPENKNIPPKPSTQINKMRGALFPKQDGPPLSLNLHIQLDVVLTF